MKNIPLSARYAKAYIDLALERGNLEQSVEAVRSVMARMESDEKLAGMLNSPLVSRQDKAAGFAGAMGDTIPQQMKDFADLVMDKGRSSIFSEILEQVIAQNDALQGVLHAGVATAVPLSVEQEKQVVEKVESVFRREDRSPSYQRGCFITGRNEDYRGRQSVGRYGGRTPGGD